jgi:hypothetical protein
MVKRTDFFEKDIAVALELTCKQANLPDLALEYCVAVSSHAPTMHSKEQRRLIQASTWFYLSQDVDLGHLHREINILQLMGASFQSSHNCFPPQDLSALFPSSLK